MATSTGLRPSLAQTYSSTSGGTLAWVPTAPAILPTAICSRASPSRWRLRRVSATQPASLNPKVVGSAWMPWVRPIITVSLWARAWRVRTCSSLVQVLLDQVHGVEELEGLGGVHHVVGGEAEVHEARLLAQALGDGSQEGDDVVVADGHDLRDPVEVVAGVADRLERLPGDGADFCPALARGDLHGEPLVHLVLLRPDAAHLRKRVFRYHCVPSNPLVPLRRRPYLSS